MKTTKFFLIVALLAYAALSYSQPEPVKTPYTIKISFERAMQKPGLVLAMRQQLNVSLINSTSGGHVPEYFYGYVIYKSQRYCICGTLKEWKAFFEVRFENHRSVS